MNYLRWWLYIILILLSGCAATVPAIPEQSDGARAETLPQSAQELITNNNHVERPGFTAQLPTGIVWYEKLSKREAVHFWKGKGPNKDEIHTLVIDLNPTPISSESRQQFMDRITAFHSAVVEVFVESTNAQLISNKFKPAQKKEEWCIEYETLYGPHRRLLVIGYYCRHPDDKEVVIKMSYSRSFYPGDEDPGFRNKAIKFLESVKLM